MIPDEVLIRLLPASCRILLQHGLPLSAVLALIHRYGGGVACVPHTADESHELAQTIGLEAARKLAAKYAGSHFYVPRGVRIKSFLRDQSILRAYAEGLPMTDIAQAHGVSDRTVRAVVARNGQPRRQGQMRS